MSILKNEALDVILQYLLKYYYVLINCSQTEIVAIMLVLLVFYDSKKSIGFFKVFFTGSTIRSDAVLT